MGYNSKVVCRDIHVQFAGIAVDGQSRAADEMG